MIQLNNPKTEKYKQFKSFVLSKEFPWFYYQSIEKHGPSSPFLSHTFLLRPATNIGGKKYPVVNSAYIEQMCEIFQEITDFNNIEVNCIYRLNANVTEPLKNIERVPTHVDHVFPHHNMLIYLTDADGATVYGEEMHNPQEDDIIIFGGGKHFHYYPTEKRRVVLVVTYV